MLMNTDDKNVSRLKQKKNDMFFIKSNISKRYLLIHY